MIQLKTDMNLNGIKKMIYINIFSKYAMQLEVLVYNIGGIYYKEGVFQYEEVPSQLALFSRYPSKQALHVLASLHVLQLLSQAIKKNNSVIILIVLIHMISH